MGFHIFRVKLQTRRIVKFTFVDFVSFEMTKGQIAVDLGLDIYYLFQLFLDGFNILLYLVVLVLSQILQNTLLIFGILKRFFVAINGLQVVFELEKLVSTCFPFGYIFHYFKLTNFYFKYNSKILIFF